MINLTLGLVLSYLLGSIPTAYLFGRLLKGVDLRRHGSGNLGATNAFRVLGRGIGTTVLALDILKGTAAVLSAKHFFTPVGPGISLNFYLCFAAIAAVCGHNWTIFLKFKGGKGVATSLGALIGFAVLIDKFAVLVLFILLLWAIVFLSTGFVSLASVVASIFLPLSAIFLGLPQELNIFLFVLAAFSLIRHKPNIIRLLQKKESRFDTRSILKKLSK